MKSLKLERHNMLEGSQRKAYGCPSMCGVCLEIYRLSEFTELKCGHQLCLYCKGEYLFIKVVKEGYMSTFANDSQRKLYSNIGLGI